MTSSVPLVPLSVAPRDEQVFPVLTSEQIARVATKGRRRAVQPGDVLIEEGQAQFPLIVVTEGELEVVRSTCNGEEVVTTHRQGQFSGELNLLAGRRGLATIRATMTGDVIVLGSTFSARTLQIREFLARNAHPVTYIDLDHDPVSQEILDRLHFS